jgi:hypothetical protein
MEHKSTGGTCTTGIGMVQSGLVHCAHRVLCPVSRLPVREVPELAPARRRVPALLAPGALLLVVVDCPNNHISILSAALAATPHGGAWPAHLGLGTTTLALTSRPLLVLAEGLS